MYGLTKGVPAAEWTRLPEKFRRKRRTAWADANATGMELDCFLEGPSFDRAGNLYVTDIPFGRVFCVSPGGEWTQVAEYDGWPNGLKIHKDGRIFITDYRRGIVVLDAASADSIDALMAQLEAASERPTILVNNAAITRDSLLLRMKPEDWDAVITTNLTGVFRLTKACVRHMVKARRGRIVNLTSVVGLTGNPGQANYAAAKAGILGFTKSLARELASRGITVNAVAPGFIDTDMTRALSEEQRQALLGQIPVGRLGAPADVAAAVLFLVSPPAAYITGETLHVNGGLYMP